MIPAIPITSRSARYTATLSSGLLLVLLAGCGGDSGGSDAVAPSKKRNVEPVAQTDLSLYLLASSDRLQYFDLYLGDADDSTRIDDYETSRWQSVDARMTLASDAGLTSAFEVTPDSVREILPGGERHWPRLVPVNEQGLVRSSSFEADTQFFQQGPLDNSVVMWHGTPLRADQDVLRLLNWQGDTLIVSLYAAGTGLVASLRYEYCSKPAPLPETFDANTECGHAEEVLVLARQQDIVDEPDEPADPQEPIEPADPVEPDNPPDPTDPADPDDPTDPTDPPTPVTPPQLILVRENPDAPPPGDDGETPPEPEPPALVDYARYMLPATTVTQDFDGYDFWSGDLSHFPGEVQIYWEESDNGMRYTDSDGDSALVTRNEANVTVTLDDGPSVEYPRWLMPDGTFSYVVRDAGNVVAEADFYAAGPYWSATLQLDDVIAHSVTDALVTVERREDPEDGLIIMTLTIHEPDTGPVAVLTWFDCDTSLLPRPDADFTGQCEPSIYIELLVSP